MVSTPRIKPLTASRAARFAVHVLVDGQLCATGPAEYCLLVPFILWPDLDLVIGERGVAICARIVDATALHLDRNNVGWSVIMFATGLRIEIDATHIWKISNHRVRIRGNSIDFFKLLSKIV